MSLVRSHAHPPYPPRVRERTLGEGLCVREHEREPGQIALELRDVGRADEPPVNVRMRHVLKRLLRTYSFRCVGIAGLGAECDHSTDAGPKTASGATIGIADVSEVGTTKQTRQKPTEARHG